MTLDNENAELRHCVQGDSCEYDRHNILFRFQSEDIILHLITNHRLIFDGMIETGCVAELSCWTTLIHHSWEYIKNHFRQQ